MAELSQYPVRVSRAVALVILNVNKKTFKKIVDANPQLQHKLKGETRCKYLRDEIAKLLAPTVCDPRGRKSKS